MGYQDKGHGVPSRRARARAGAALNVAALLVSVACTGTGSGSKFSGRISVTVANPDRCDPLDTRGCLLPFPSDTFTVADPSTPTGRRVHLDVASMPANKAGVHIDPTQWNRNDGFSPGHPITVYVPGLDVDATGLANAGNIGPSLAPNAPIVLLDATTRKRVPYWAELDATATADADRLLIVRPASNFLEGHRVVIGMRRLIDQKGKPIAPSDVFRGYRDRLQTDVPSIEARRPRYDRVFASLSHAGVHRSDLFLAWDFTVASAKSLAGPMLHMRDEAFKQLGAASPRFAVTSVTPGGASGLARTIAGTFQVPLFLTSQAPGSTLVLGPLGVPVSSGMYTAKFRCIVPQAALTVPARPAVYGHGLLGDVSEVEAGNVKKMAEEHNFVFCATNWLGFSSDDIGANCVNSGRFSMKPSTA